MNQCLIFCRTNLDCDNMEKFLTACGGGRWHNVYAVNGPWLLFCGRICGLLSKCMSFLYKDGCIRNMCTDCIDQAWRLGMALANTSHTPACTRPRASQVASFNPDARVAKRIRTPALSSCVSSCTQQQPQCTAIDSTPDHQPGGHATNARAPR